MKPGMKLAILLISGVLIWGGIFFFACSSNNTKERARLVAEKSLMACVDCPETVEIKAFSDADSVFGREYITLDERVAIATSMMKISSRVMEQTDNMENIDFNDVELAGLMERQMSAMSALRSLTGLGPDIAISRSHSPVGKSRSSMRLRLPTVSRIIPNTGPYLTRTLTV